MALHDLHDDFDLSALSPAARARFVRLSGGLRGGDGDDAVPGDGETPPGETLPAETPASEGETPPEGETPEGETPPEGSGPEVPSDLTTLEPEALRDLHDALGEARNETRENARTPMAIERIEELTEQRRQVAAEMQRRIDEDRQMRERLAQLDEDMAGEAALPELESVPVASVAPRPPSSRALAVARGRQTPAAQDPPRSGPPALRTPLLAAVAGNSVGIGAEMNLGALGEVLDRVKRSNARTIVANFAPFEEMAVGAVPEIIGRASPERNSELMREAREEWYARRRGEAMTAAICTPLDILRDIDDAFNTSTPVSSMFPSRPAGRLGFQYFRSIGLADVAAGSVIWTEDDQAAVDLSDDTTWKDCLDIDCPTALTVAAEAVVGCLTWDLTTEMSNPEHVANLVNALTAARARNKDGRILSLIDAASHRYNYTAAYGAVPTLIDLLNTVMAQATFAGRLEDAGYTVILPPGVVQLLRIDLANRGYSSDLPATEDALAYVRDRVEGVSEVLMSLDRSSSTTDPEPGLPFFPLNPVGNPVEDLPSLESISGGFHRIRILDPGAGLYAETGGLNVGTTRDSQLLRANKVQYFAEEFVLLAKQGAQPWFSVDVQLCADGARAGLLEPVGCTS